MTLLSTGTDYDALAAAFRPIFTRIAQGAAEREQQRILPEEPIRWLKKRASARCVSRARGRLGRFAAAAQRAADRAGASGL